MNQLEVRRSTKIFTSVEDLWEALTSSEYTSKYMFNCSVEADWRVGGDIIWEGEFQGYKAYQTGKILEFIPNKLLKYTTFDKQTGLEDTPANHVHVTYLLEEKDDHVEFISVMNNFNGDVTRASHSATGWDNVVLPNLIKLFEPKAVQ